MKVALIHGWGHTIYTSSGCKSAWENRKDFTDALAKDFDILMPNLPGFCGQTEPNRPWDIVDFSDYFNDYLKGVGFDPDFVLGYSFGAPVALTWKLKYNHSAKLILVAPAISRAYSKDGFLKHLFFLKSILPKKFLETIRSLYLTSIKNQYYTKGTDFIKRTYLQIVKQDLSDKLLSVSPKDVLIIFGSNDTATPAKELIKRLEENSAKYNIQIIEGGGHDIANTHYKEIIYLIKKFSNYEDSSGRFENHLV